MDANDVLVWSCYLILFVLAFVGAHYWMHRTNFGAKGECPHGVGLDDYCDVCDGPR